MIQLLKRDPMFERVFIFLLAALAGILLMALSIQYYSMGVLHRQFLQLQQQMVGSLVKIYPEQEHDIVQQVLNMDMDSRSSGEIILRKYGYGQSTRFYEDTSFKGSAVKFFASDAAFLFLASIIMLAVFIYLIRQFNDRVDRLSIAVDSVMEGDAAVDDYSLQEGAFAGLDLRLRQMARSLELSLSKVRKEKDNIQSLVTDISHQLKTPLSSIKVFNTLIMEDKLDESEQREFLERSRNEIWKLEWLIGALMKISKLETGMISLNREPRSLRNTLYEAVSGVYVSAEKKQIEIQMGPMEDLVISHDPKWTKEAIFNVLENAVKYLERDGWIDIQVSEMEFFIRIDVQDNGIGIPREEFNSIFKRFYRGNSERVKGTEGAGVGLYLTRKILEEQGGYVLVDSIPGEGSKFSLFLQKC